MLLWVCIWLSHDWLRITFIAALLWLRVSMLGCLRAFFTCQGVSMCTIGCLKVFFTCLRASMCTIGCLRVYFTCWVICRSQGKWHYCNGKSYGGVQFLHSPRSPTSLDEAPCISRMSFSCSVCVVQLLWGRSMAYQGAKMIGMMRMMRTRMRIKATTPTTPAIMTTVRLASFSSCFAGTTGDRQREVKITNCEIRESSSLWVLL